MNENITNEELEQVYGGNTGPDAAGPAGYGATRAIGRVGGQKIRLTEKHRLELLNESIHSMNTSYEAGLASDSDRDTVSNFIDVDSEMYSHLSEFEKQDLLNKQQKNLDETRSNSSIDSSTQSYYSQARSLKSNSYSIFTSETSDTEFLSAQSGKSLAPSEIDFHEDFGLEFFNENEDKDGYDLKVIDVLMKINEHRDFISPGICFSNEFLLMYLLQKQVEYLIKRFQVPKQLSSVSQAIFFKYLHKISVCKIRKSEISSKVDLPNSDRRYFNFEEIYTLYKNDAIFDWRPYLTEINDMLTTGPDLNFEEKYQLSDCEKILLKKMNINKVTPSQNKKGENNRQEFEIDDIEVDAISVSSKASSNTSSKKGTKKLNSHRSILKRQDYLLILAILSKITPKILLKNYKQIKFPNRFNNVDNLTKDSWRQILGCQLKSKSKSQIKNLDQTDLNENLPTINLGYSGSNALKFKKSIKSLVELECFRQNDVLLDPDQLIVPEMDLSKIWYQSFQKNKILGSGSLQKFYKSLEQLSSLKKKKSKAKKKSSAILEKSNSAQKPTTFKNHIQQTLAGVNSDLSDLSILYFGIKFVRFLCDRADLAHEFLIDREDFYWAFERYLIIFTGVFSKLWKSLIRKRLYFSTN